MKWKATGFVFGSTSICKGSGTVKQVTFSNELGGARPVALENDVYEPSRTLQLAAVSLSKHKTSSTPRDGSAKRRGSLMLSGSRMKGVGTEENDERCVARPPDKTT